MSDTHAGFRTASSLSGPESGFRDIRWTPKTLAL